MDWDLFIYDVELGFGDVNIEVDGMLWIGICLYDVELGLNDVNIELGGICYGLGFVYMIMS